MALTVDTAKLLLDEVYDLTGIDATVKDDYSGRGMSGKIVVAFSIPSGYHDEFVATLGFAAAKLDLDLNDLPVRSDNLGMGTVLY